MITESPLFQVATSGIQYELNIGYQNTEVTHSPYDIAKAYLEGRGTDLVQAVSLPTTGIRIDTRTAATGIAISGVEEAEDYVLDLAPSSKAELTSSQYNGGYPWDDLNTPSRVLASHIQRSSSLVAAHTRRGAGNMALMGFDMFHLLSKTYPEMLDMDETQCGRWSQKGFVNSRIKVYVGDVLPPNEVFVAYVGSSKLIDGPVGLLDFGGYHLLPRSVTNLAKPESFVRRIRFDLAVD